jgi:hypothetical protein
MADNPLAKKLQIKPGQRIAVVNPPPAYLDALAPLPPGSELADGPAGTLDGVQLFVKDSEELARLWPAAQTLGKPDCVLWIAYPKQSSKIKTDLNRDQGWQPVYSTGLRPVSQVSIDETWSAVRFRPTEKVGRPWPPAQRT